MCSGAVCSGTPCCMWVLLPHRFLKSQKKQLMMEMIKWVSLAALRVPSIMHA